MTKGALRAAAAAYGMVTLLSASALPAQAPKEPAAPAAAELTALLKEFLAGASRSDTAVHERFWADDLIYTRGLGQRIGKADILRDVRSTPPSKADAPATTYSAEDIRIQQYGETAVVAFRLVGTTTGSAEPVIADYLDTGTFVRRKGRWQAVAWQATRVPRPEAAAEKELQAAQAAFHRSVVGHSGIVRGTSPRQRAAFPGSPTGDAEPFTAFFTMTFVDEGGAWKAVALHTSR